MDALLGISLVLAGWMVARAPLQQSKILVNSRPTKRTLQTYENAPRRLRPPVAAMSLETRSLFSAALLTLRAKPKSSTGTLLVPRSAICKTAAAMPNIPAPDTGFTVHGNGKPKTGLWMQPGLFFRHPLAEEVHVHS